MAVNTEITRIQQAKSDIAAAAIYRNSADISVNNLIDTYPSSLLKLDGYANYIPRTNEVVHWTTGDSFYYDVLCAVPLYFISSSAFYIMIYKSGSVPIKTIQYQITTDFDNTTKQPIFSSASVNWTNFNESSYFQVPANTAIAFRSTSTTGMSDSGGYRTFMFSSSTSFNAPASANINYTKAPVYAGGNIMSLMNWQRTISESACFWNLFLNAAALKSAPCLPATILAGQCYYGMFRKCIGLEYPPILPSKSLGIQCYKEMFSQCRCLKRFPDLPAVTPADSAYYQMFYGCKRPNRIKCMTYEDDGTGSPSLKMSACFTDWLIYTSPQGLIVHPRPDLLSGISSTTVTPSGWELKSHEYNMSDYTN